ncbi:NAD(P)-binding protein [Penicillium chermesinum]|uniref:NAD(P)-binding protein n=1 Tax=Penicillium chermesinum TaxID=63820 RepID=A0A9W9NQ99_9EURO|nr:NAD(P)-binding protein [Penicillium chermesinum]KAJ5223918.1 NAD(P)-binding protein [Penicillium chermesinum]
MAAPTTTRQWILRSKPTALPTYTGANPTFELQTASLPQLGENQVLVKTLYLSNDPAQRGAISANADPKRMYAPPVPEGAPMRSYGIAEVVQSNAASHPVGTLCITTTNWMEYSVQEAAQCRVLQVPEGLKVTHLLGAFGMTGLTAYYGLVEVAKAGPEDTVVVSGAAGATGNMVVQIAKKIVGCKRVIGIAGSEEKCRWVEGLGADVCLNYKAASFNKDLERETEGFVEVYFDNVGGDILDTMFTRMKVHGRIAFCGAISAYNTTNEGDPD